MNPQDEDRIRKQDAKEALKELDDYVRRMIWAASGHVIDDLAGNVAEGWWDGFHDALKKYRTVTG